MSANPSSSSVGQGLNEEQREKYKKMVANFVPYDPRFPNQNQTKNCTTNYIDYYRCLKKKDEDYCAWYKNAYKQLCPPEWYEKWDEQRANGSFPVRDVL
jgi:cytochrome c oxidase subunit 6b